MISRQDQLVRAYQVSFHPLDVLAPTFGNTDIDVEEIERAPNCLVHHLFDAFGPSVKRRNRRGDNSAHFSDRLHLANMTGVEGRLAQHQNQAPAFLEDDIGSTRQ